MNGKKIRHFTYDKGVNQNYRVEKNHKFNNNFFENLKHKLSDNLSTIYNNCSQNSDFSKDGGYVHVELFKDDENGFKQNILKKIIQEIKTLTTKNKYNFNDITILCNSRKRVSLVSEYLSFKWDRCCV